MKYNFTNLVAAFILTAFSFTSKSFAQAPSDIFISEYVEGTSNNKALEFYNGTGSAIDLTAGNYIIQMYFNGSTTLGTTVSLTGTIPANGVFVLAHSSASFASSSFVNQTNGSSWYNGDDVIIVKKGGAGGTIVDVIGQLGVDPGVEWGAGLASGADNTLRRKAADCTGDVNSGDAYDPSVKFDGFATDDFSGLGSHTSSCTVGESISLAPLSLNFSTTPGTPSAQQSYTVQGNSLTNDITVTIPALSNFGLSLVSGGPYTGSINITAASANAGPVTVYVIFNPSSAGTQSGNITHASGSVTSNLAVQGTTTTGGITPVYDIQGTGSASLQDGNIVTTEGIVTADFQGSTQLNGFFIQDATGDGNTSTSDGIFVFNSSFSVNVGDHVRLTGEVDEFFTKTEIKNITALTVLSSGNPLMTPVNITLPVAALTDLESFEGMLTKFPQTLTVTETFTLARFGEVSLSTGGRIFNPTNFVDPNDNPASGTTSTGTSNVAAVTAQQNLNDRSRILLDDASSVQNPAVVPYLDAVNNTLRCGSTLTDLTGVLDYDFSVYRVQPTVVPAFNYAARPAVPAVGGNIKAASFNVLNYFNGNGSGGGFPTERGAHTLAEFNRQRVKIIAAIKELDADVVGLIEIENDGSGATSAIADLVNGLNAATASGTYAYILDPAGANGNTGTDAIKQAIIYKPAKLTPVGLAIGDMNAAHNRPPIAQTFTVNTGGEKFTFIVTHFKSKSCTGASGVNADQGDGQGCFNASRKAQANALLSFIAGIQSSTADADVISVGDYNAYEQEDPMDILNAGGLINLLSGTYSYVFEGQSGSLDHALVTSSLFAKINGADKWHINADEPIAKDYNQEFNPAYMYSPDAFRSSDHDPVLAGLNLQQAISPVVAITNPVDGATFNPGNTISLQAEASDADGSIVKVEFYNDGIKFAVDSTAPYEFVRNGIEAGAYTVTAKAFDNSGDSTVSDTVRITVINCTPAGNISAEGFTDIPGSAVTNLTSHPDYPNNPSVTAGLSKFEYGNNIGDNYGARVRGYICVPQTGYYTFYIASDDQSELWLSTDDDPANKVKIASVNSPVGFRSWFVYPTQRSVPVRLIKGGRYYIETLHKENTGSDHLSVAWLLPSGAFEGPVYGNRLSPFTSSPTITQARGGSGFGELMTAATKADTKAELIKGLSVNAMPNPSTTQFTLNTRSNSTDILTITVTDVMGRVVEKRSNVAANNNLQFGNKYQPGIYFVEVKQGAERKILKLVKQ